MRKRTRQFKVVETIEHTVQADSEKDAIEMVIDPGEDVQTQVVNVLDRRVYECEPDGGEPTNAQRVAEFDKRLKATDYQDKEDSLVDLLTDAQHWCEHNNVDFFDKLRIAGNHFTDEQAAEAKTAAE